jgi:signal transduction histidine kinase
MAAPAGPARTQRSIRSTISLLLILPLVTMAGLYVYALSGTIGPAFAKQASAAVNDDIGAPDAFMTQALELEESDTFVWQASHHRAPGIDLHKDYAATDGAVAAFQAGLAKAQGDLSSAARTASATFLDALARRAQLRAAVQAGSTNGLKTFQGYLAIMQEGFTFSNSLANPNASIKENQQSEALIASGIGTFDVAAEGTLLGGVIAGGGYMTPAEYQLFAQLYYDQVSHFNTVNDPLLWQVSPDPYYPSVLGPGAMNSPQAKAVIALEKKVLAEGSNRQTVQLAITPAQLQQVIFGALAPTGPLLAAEETGRLGVTANNNHQGNVILWRLGIVGGVGLLVVIISTFLLLRFGNRIARELTGLRGAARALSGERLPSVVRRLRAGEDVDVAAEAPPLALRTRTREVTDTAEAFSAVQRTAVEAAVEQAQLRKGVSNVFRSLARRNQSLVQRQLRMLDEMERGTQDPDALAQLFRLDHLTTRMRRQAEGLIILSGAAPGRRWRQPVAVVEVLRGAISEIEDYVRVDLVTDSPDYLTGAAVADVTHLLAELIENAVVYSPPATRVQVRGGRVANGYVIEVEDRGLGIPVATRETLNERLAQPPEFDLADSDQLGLFVVSRLAVRNSIRVSLRESGYGGTTAIVLLPAPLVVSETEAATLTAQGSRGALAAGGEPADGSGEPVSVLPGRRTPRLDRPASPFAESASPFAGSASPFAGSASPFAGSALPAEGMGQAHAASQPFGGGDPFGGGQFAGGQPDSSPAGTSPTGTSWAFDSTRRFETAGNGAGGNGGGFGNGQPARGGGFGEELPARPGRGSFGNPLPFQDAPASLDDGPAARRDSGFSFQGGPAPARTTGQFQAAGDGGGQADGTGPSGLPKRQKMASMAPQLRENRPEAPKGPLSGRSPDQARALLSSIQRGLRTGREEGTADGAANDAEDGEAGADDEAQR